MKFKKINIRQKTDKKSEMGLFRYFHKEKKIEENIIHSLREIEVGKLKINYRSIKYVRGIDWVNTEEVQ